MANDKKIPTINPIDLKSPLSKAKEIKIDSTKVQEWKKSLETKQTVSLDGKKTKKDLEKAAGESNISLGPVPNNKPNVAVRQNGNSCKAFCREEGFHILPLRYSVTQGKAVNLPKNLGDNVKSVSINHSKYIVEMIDTGYIYQLIVRTSGKKEWWAYKVTPSGYLSLFPIQKPAPISVPEFACKSANHNVAASLITVPHNPKDIEKTTYILYSHIALTQRIIKKLESNPEDFYNKGHWQKIDVAAWKGGSQNQKHCLNNTNLKSSINNVNSFGERINLAVKKFAAEPKFFASIALYDPIGITVKLNDYRNDAYIAVDDFLEKKDKNGVSNQRKLDAAQRLDTLKSSLAQSVTQFHTSREMGTRTPIDGRLQGRLLTIEELSKAAQQRGDVQEVARLEKSKQEVLKEHADLMNQREQNKEIIIEEKTKADFKVCDDNLNFEEAANFKKIASLIIENAKKLANSRAQDHLNWIISESLLDALDVYDDKDLQNGCAFKAHVASMLFGMEGADSASKKLDEWIKKPEFERKNLFIRGLYSNQLEAKAKHDEVKNTAIDLTAAGIKATKALADFLKKTDSAWDEWARNQGSDKNKGNIGFFKAEKKLMLFVSNFARVIFRAGMGTTAESNFVRAISQKLLFAQMGELASKLEFNQVVYGVDPEKLTGGKVTPNPDFNKKVDGMLSGQAAKQATIQSLDRLIDDAMVKKQQVALTLEQIEEIGSKGMNNHTNNYHQVRASGVLILIEAVNLAHMLNSGKYKDPTQIAALVASISALMAFGLDVFYGLAKGAREVANQSAYAGAGAAATRGAANIQRAGIKWVAGSLSALAGGITAWLDYQKVKSLIGKEGVPISLIVLYSVRTASGAVGVFLGICAALTYIGPLMTYLQRVRVSPFIQRMGATVFGKATFQYSIKKMTREIVRNVLLRGISWVSGIGLILTIAEVAILIYMDSTKLRRWCEHSTFRKDNSKKLMPEKQEAEDYQALFA